MKRFFTRKRLTVEERTVEGFGVVIVLPEKITLEEAERWRAEWMSRHANPAT